MDLKFAYTEAESKVRDALVEAIDKCFDDEPDWWQNRLLPALSENYEIEKTPTEKSIVEMELNHAYKLLTYRTDGKLDSMHKFTKFYHLDFNRFRYLLTETKLIRNFVSHRSKKTEINMDVESVKMDIGNCKKLIESFSPKNAKELSDIVVKLSRQKKSVKEVAETFDIEIADVMALAYKFNFEFADGYIMVDDDFYSKMIKELRTQNRLLSSEQSPPLQQATEKTTPTQEAPLKEAKKEAVVIEQNPKTISLTTPEANRFFNLVLIRPIIFLSDCLIKPEAMNFFNRTVIPAILRAKEKDEKRRIYIMDITLNAVLKNKSTETIKTKELSYKAYEIIKYLMKHDLVSIIDGENETPFEQEMLISSLEYIKDKKPVVFTQNPLVANEVTKICGQSANTYTYDDKDKLIEVKLEYDEHTEEVSTQNIPQPEHKEEKNQSKETIQPTPKPNENGLFKYKTTVSGVDRSVIKTSVIPYEDDTVISKKYGQLVLEEEFAGGGEGLLYKTNKKGLIAKVYKEERITKDRLEKLKLMISHEIDAPHVCWPLDIITNQNGEFVGYVMKEGKGRKLYNLLINPKNLEKYFSNWDRRNLVKLSITILEAFKSIHNQNILAGDVNLYNILVENDESVYFVDCDSYQIDKFQSTVGIEGFIAPEIYDYMDKINGGNLDLEKTMRTFESESFAIASLIFHILFLGQSPYASVGNESIAKSVKGRQFAYPFGNRNGYLSPAGYWRFIWSHLTFQMKEMFDDIFVKDKRFSDDYMIDKLKGYLNDMEKREHISKELIPTKYKEAGNTEFVSLKCSMCNTDFNLDKDTYEKKTDTEKSQLLCQTCIRAITALKKTPEIYNCPTCRRKVTTTKWDYARQIDNYGSVKRRCNFCQNMTYRQIQDYLYPPKQRTTTTHTRTTASSARTTASSASSARTTTSSTQTNRTYTTTSQPRYNTQKQQTLPKIKVPLFITKLYNSWQKNVFKNTFLILLALMSYLYIKEYGITQYLQSIKEIVLSLLNLIKFIIGGVIEFIKLFLS